MSNLEHYIRLSKSIPGWVRGDEARELALASFHLPAGAVIVEIGTFLGSGTVILAGARRLQGSGRVHCVDPFDCSGDAASVPHYIEILEAIDAGDRQGIERAFKQSAEAVVGSEKFGEKRTSLPATATSLRQHFDANIRRTGLSEFVTPHEGLAKDVAANWSTAIDMLFLDGDQSPHGAREAYESWAPFLKRDGIIWVHNSGPGEYEEGHDGNYRLSLEEIRPPKYSDVRVVSNSTFARNTM